MTGPTVSHCRAATSWRVGLIYGGDGPEWTLSRRSADHVAAHLADHVGSVTRVCLRASGGGDPDPADALVLALAPNAGDAPDARDTMACDHETENARRLAALGLDAALSLVMGPVSLQRQVWRLAEAVGLPLVGNAPEAHRMGWDKHRCKILMRQLGIPTPSWLLVEPGADPARVARALALPLPVMVKPVEGGSSYGIARADTPAEVAEACAQVLPQGDRALVEAWVSGPEVCAGALGRSAGSGPFSGFVPGEAPNAAPGPVPLDILRVRHQGRFFDQHTKSSMAFTLEPATDLAPEVARQAQVAALALHRATGCTAMSRLDLILTEDGPMALDFNTVPGLSKASILPHMLAGQRLTLGQALVGLLQDAVFDASCGLTSMVQSSPPRVC